MYRLLVLLSLCCLWPSVGHSAQCDDILPNYRSETVSRRSISVDDLVRLRDIGPVANYDQLAGLVSTSPDQTRIAFQVRRADPEANAYCLAIIVLPLAPGSHPIIADVGGDLIRIVSSTSTGFANLESGTAAVITPKWSPDGAMVAFLRRDHGSIQVWVASTDGSGSHQLSSLPFDVEAFDWGTGGTSILASGRPGISEFDASAIPEGRRGFLYDDRYAPEIASHPLPTGVFASETYSVALSDGMAKLVKEHQSDRAPKLGFPIPGAVFLQSDNDGAIWTEPTQSDRVNAPSILRVKMPTGSVETCTPEYCDWIIAAWWSADRKSVLFLRRGGWAISKQLLYRWTPGTIPVKILNTEDVLSSCTTLNSDLICAREGAARPREIVLINTKSGAIHEIFDPNPEFRDLDLGAVKRLHWRNAFGIETIGDLVLPPGQSHPTNLPLIIVGYSTRGFLRGGTGDEYPIQVFAAHGYAVLSFQRPLDWGYLQGAPTYEEADRLNRVDWNDRQSVLSSIEMGIDTLAADGIVDPAKVGITGFSDGASTVQFGLINTNRFAAAVFSNCCEDKVGVNTLLGPSMGREMRQLGYPGLTENGKNFWSRFSITQRAQDVRTPILMQLADREYLYALESYTALKQLGRPVAMYVFPDEYHVKWQPAHRKAVYQRNVDWFDFWLKGISTNEWKDLGISPVQGTENNLGPSSRP